MCVCPPTLLSFLQNKSTFFVSPPLPPHTTTTPTHSCARLGAVPWHVLLSLVADAAASSAKARVFCVKDTCASNVKDLVRFVRETPGFLSVGAAPDGAGGGSADAEAEADVRRERQSAVARAVGKLRDYINAADASVLASYDSHMMQSTENAGLMEDEGMLSSGVPRPAPPS
jgi:hypothetical protein